MTQKKCFVSSVALLSLSTASFLSFSLFIDSARATVTLDSVNQRVNTVQGRINLYDSNENTEGSIPNAKKAGTDAQKGVDRLQGRIIVHDGDESTPGSIEEAKKAGEDAKKGVKRLQDKVDIHGGSPRTRGSIAEAKKAAEDAQKVAEAAQTAAAAAQTAVEDLKNTVDIHDGNENTEGSIRQAKKAADDAKKAADDAKKLAAAAQTAAAAAQTAADALKIKVDIHGGNENTNGSVAEAKKLAVAAQTAAEAAQTAAAAAQTAAETAQEGVDDLRDTIINIHGGDENTEGSIRQAKKAADDAQKAVDNLKNKVDGNARTRGSIAEAYKAADDAKKAADDLKNKVDIHGGNARTRGSIAEAYKAADDAKKAADDAQRDLNLLKTKVDGDETISGSIAEAKKAAEDAQKAGDDAKKAGDDAKKAADDANTNLAEKVREIRTEFSRLTGLIEKAQGDIVKEAKALNTFKESNFSPATTRLSKVERKADSLEESLNTMETNFGSQVNKIPGMDQDLGTAKEDITSLKGSVKDSSKNISTLITSTDDLKKKIDRMEPNLTTAQADIREAMRNINTLEQTLTNLGADAATKIELDAEIKKLLRLIDAVTPKVDTLVEDVDALKKYMDKLKLDLPAIEVNANTANSNAQQALNRANESNGKVADLTTALGLLNGIVAGIRGEFDLEKVKIGNLEKNVEKLTENGIQDRIAIGAAQAAAEKAQEDVDALKEDVKEKDDQQKKALQDAIKAADDALNEAKKNLEDALALAVTNTATNLRNTKEALEDLISAVNDKAEQNRKAIEATDGNVEENRKAMVAGIEAGKEALKNEKEAFKLLIKAVDDKANTNKQGLEQAQKEVDAVEVLLEDLIEDVEEQVRANYDHTLELEEQVEDNKKAIEGKASKEEVVTLRVELAALKKSIESLGNNTTLLSKENVNIMERLRLLEAATRDAYNADPYSASSLALLEEVRPSIGEIHPSIASFSISNTPFLTALRERSNTFSFTQQNANKKGDVWSSFLYDQQLVKSEIVSDVETKSQNFIVGVDFTPYQGFVYGIFGAYGASDVTIKAVKSLAQLKDYTFGGYGKAFIQDSLSILVGASFTQEKIKTQRYEEIKADYSSKIVRIFSTISYPIEYETTRIEPFLDGVYSLLRTNKFSESIGDDIYDSSALRGQNLFSTVGFRVGKNLTNNLLVKGSAGFRQGFGDLFFAQEKTLETNSFKVNGYTIPQNSIVINASLDWTFNRVGVSVSYDREMDIMQKYYKHDGAVRVGVSF